MGHGQRKQSPKVAVGNARESTHENQYKEACVHMQGSHLRQLLTKLRTNTSTNLGGNTATHTANIQREDKTMHQHRQECTAQQNECYTKEGQRSHLEVIQDGEWIDFY